MATWLDATLCAPPTSAWRRPHRHAVPLEIEPTLLPLVEAPLQLVEMMVALMTVAMMVLVPLLLMLLLMLLTRLVLTMIKETIPSQSSWYKLLH